MADKTRLLLAVAAAAAMTLSACGSSGVSPANPAAAASSGGSPASAATESNPPGDIPDNQAYVAFTPPGSPVSVKVPEGWARSTEGSATVFTDKLNRIEIQTSPAAAAPTTTSVSAVDLPRLQATVPKFAAGQVTAASGAAGPVILLTYQGDSASDPVTGKVVRDAFERYTYFKAGTRVDLTLSGPVNADNVDPWRIVSDSVRWAP